MRTIVSVQALRAVAALSAVLWHFNQIWLMVQGRANDPIALSAGPVLSSPALSRFIRPKICWANPTHGGMFLTRRIARIVPLLVARFN
jgi:peptidoglycan/LPS O-acetylase OafA/YrhL